MIDPATARLVGFDSGVLSPVGGHFVSIEEKHMLNRRWTCRICEADVEPFEVHEHLRPAV